MPLRAPHSPPSRQPLSSSPPSLPPAGPRSHNLRRPVPADSGGCRRRAALSHGCLPRLRPPHQPDASRSHETLAAARPLPAGPSRRLLPALSVLSRRSVAHRRSCSASLLPHRARTSLSPGGAAARCRAVASSPPPRPLGPQREERGPPPQLLRVPVAWRNGGCSSSICSTLFPSPASGSWQLRIQCPSRVLRDARSTVAFYITRGPWPVTAWWVLARR